MAIIDRVYTGGAVQAVVQGTMTPTVPGAGGTFIVNDDTGWPVTGKFTVKLNRGLSDEEHLVCDSRVGTTFTVGQRGADGTNAQAHNSPTCEIYFDARSANLIVDHVDDVEADPHATKLLNNARHDITARHTYGAGLGTRPTPVSVGTTLTAGSGSNPAAGDHGHDVGVGAIDAANLFAAGVVDQAAIDTNAVGTLEIIDLNVTSAKLAAASVTSAKLAAASVIAGKIAAGGVSATDQLADGIITPAKFATVAVSTYTPTVQGIIGGANTVYGNYIRLGKLVVLSAGFILGVGGDGNPDNSLIGFSLPSGLAADFATNVNIRYVFGGWANDSAGPARYAFSGILDPGDPTVVSRFVNAATTLGFKHDLPFNWNQGDQLFITGYYFTSAA